VLFPKLESAQSLDNNYKAWTIDNTVVCPCYYSNSNIERGIL
jgi:ferredoxin-thioredoxin reductase catalytic subunit